MSTITQISNRFQLLSPTKSKKRKRTRSSESKSEFPGTGCPLSPLFERHTDSNRIYREQVSPELQNLEPLLSEIDDGYFVKHVMFYEPKMDYFRDAIEILSKRGINSVSVCHSNDDDYDYELDVVVENLKNQDMINNFSIALSNQQQIWRTVAVLEKKIATV